MRMETVDPAGAPSGFLLPAGVSFAAKRAVGPTYSAALGLAAGYVYLSPGAAHVVPKRAFRDPHEAEEFYQRLRAGTESGR